MSPGRRIRYLREHNNLSQKQLSTDLGYKTYTTISKWEAGASLPPGKDLKKLAEYFKVSTDYILGLQDYTSLTYYNTIEHFTDIDYIEDLTPELPLEEQTRGIVRVANNIIQDTGDHYFIVNVNTESMNRVIPKKSKVVLRIFKEYDSVQLKDNDIVVVQYNGQYKLKRYVETDSFHRLEVESFDDSFEPILLTKQITKETIFIGKIIFVYNILD